VIAIIFVLFVVETTSKWLSNDRAKSTASRQVASTASEAKSTAQSVPQPTQPHSWAVSEGTDPVQGTPVMVLKLYSENSGDSLLVQCASKKTSVAYGVWAGALPGNDLSVSVILRFDQAKPEHTRLRYDSSGWYWVQNPIPFARKLARSQILGIEYTDALENVTIDQFRVGGFDKLLPKVARACGWGAARG